jgi:hypothetical protein
MARTAPDEIVQAHLLTVEVDDGGAEGGHDRGAVDAHLVEQSVDHVVGHVDAVALASSDADVSAVVAHAGVASATAGTHQ